MAVRRNDHSGILVRENLDELGSLGKVFVSRVFGPEEGNTRGIRDVHVLGTLGGELNEGLILGEVFLKAKSP
jgi:hypothetical protein